MLRSARGADGLGDQAANELKEQPQRQQGIGQALKEGRPGKRGVMDNTQAASGPKKRQRTGRGAGRPNLSTSDTLLKSDSASFNLSNSTLR